MQRPVLLLWLLTKHSALAHHCESQTTLFNNSRTLLKHFNHLPIRPWAFVQFEASARPPMETFSRPPESLQLKSIELLSAQSKWWCSSALQKGCRLLPSFVLLPSSARLTSDNSRRYLSVAFQYKFPQFYLPPGTFVVLHWLPYCSSRLLHCTVCCLD